MPQSQDIPRTIALNEWLTDEAAGVRVCFTDIGEGLCGEWDDTDPDDMPLLRLDVQVRDWHDQAGEDATLYDPTATGWTLPHEWTMCTHVHADTDPATLHGLLTHALSRLSGASSIKGTLDELSWLRADSLTSAPL